jgi:hypothetical protein
VREIIHPDYPFTVEEDAAAWICRGVPAQEALATAANMKAELSAIGEMVAAESKAASEGWSSSPRVHLVGEFKALVHLVADIHSGGALLSAAAREKFIREWTTRLTPGEASSRLEQLDHLGDSWLVRRDAFHRLLTAGQL